MKKLLLIAIIACALQGCKKTYCFVCTNQGGNDETFCNMTQKEADQKEAQGYDCRRK